MTLAPPDTHPACIERDPRELAYSWSALAASRSEPSAFLTPEWITVARAHDRGTPVTLAIGDPPLGVAALARDDDGTIRFAGGELTDEQDVVATAGSEAVAAQAFARWLVAAAPPRVDLSYVPEDRPTLSTVAAALAGAGYTLRVERQVTAPRLALADDFETYVRGLGKKERHELRRKLRRIEQAGGAEYRVTGDAEREAVLARFFALHRLSRGRKATFMTAERERFFRDAADALASCGRLRLGALRHGGADVAVLFGFAYQGALALYNAAYDPALASLSIGIASHAYAVREAIAEGCRTYDLLRGDEPYKYDLGAKDRWLCRLVAQRDEGPRDEPPSGRQGPRPLGARSGDAVISE